MRTSDTHIGFADLVLRLKERFESVGAAPWIAACLAENCALCEQAGTLSHGVFRMKGYLNSIASGWVDAKAEPDLLL
jgi:delta1-piperideine-2-carboxylate reductase